MPRGLRNSISCSSLILVSLSAFLVSGCTRDPNVRKQKYFESGVRYEKKGELREAVIQFQNALRFDKSYAAAHYELAKTYMALNQPTQAYPELQRTVDLAPNNIQARIDLGNLLVSGRLPDKGEEQARAVLAVQPNNADAYSLLARVAEAHGNTDEALKNIQHALELDPNRSAFNAQLGLLEARTAPTGPNAQQHLEKAVAEDGSNVSAREALAAVLNHKGDTQGAQSQLEAAVAAAPKNLQARAVLAAFYMQANNQAAAEATVRKASDDFPENPEAAVMLARYYAATGQGNKAEPAYADLARKHPKSVPVQVNYAEVLLQDGKMDQAQSVVKDLNKDDPEVQAVNAAILMQQGKNDDAYSLLQTAVKNNPDNNKLQTLLGMSAMQKGNLEVAQANFSAAAQRDPRNLNAQRGLAQLALRKGDRAQLRQVADTTLKAYPQFSDAYVWRATVEASDKQFDTATADIQQALKLNPKNAQAMVAFGQIKLHQGKAAEGKAMLEQALAADPNSPALGMLAALDIQAHQPGAAVTRIQDQIAKGKPTSLLYDQLTAAQMMNKDVNGALASAQKAMQLNPDDIIARGNFTQASMAAGQLAPAMNSWEQYMASHPKDARGPRAMGLLYESAGDQANAIKSYQKSIELDPNQPIVANNLAFLMIENNGNTDVALSLAQRAHQAMPDSPDTADTLAWVYYKKGLYPSALDLLQQAVKTAPENASIQYHLGMTLSRMNNKAEAINHLKRASQIAPDTTAGKNAAQELSHLS